MSAFQFLKSSEVFVEIGQSSLKALHEETGLEVPLERQSNGRLTGASKEAVLRQMQAFLRNKNRLVRPRAFCAIGARGVSLRALALPATTRDNFSQLLELQVEKEFPLSPHDLAWGCCQASLEPLPPNGGRAARDLIVAAIKKEVIEDYLELLIQCGLNPVFTLGSLATSSIFPKLPGGYALLDIGRSDSQFIAFENGIPQTVRSFPWGGDDLTRSLQDAQGISFAEAEALKLQLSEAFAARVEPASPTQEAIGKALASLAKIIKDGWTGQRLYLTGRSVSIGNIAEELAAQLGGGIICEQREISSGVGQSAAILGLQRWSERDGRWPPLVFQVRSDKSQVRRADQSATRKWVALVALMACGIFFWRYGETLLKKPGLARKLDAIKNAPQSLLAIDQKLSFYQHLETNQAPYLDLISVLADAADRGTRFESLTLTRRGDLLLRGVLPNAEKATSFRDSLIASGWFLNVVLEEQTPVQNKINLRMSARWKPGKKELPSAETNVNAARLSAPAQPQVVENPGN